MINLSFKSKEDFLKSQNKEKNLDLAVDAQDAVHGKEYFCAYCGCRVFKKTSTNGVAFFARFKGEEHTDEICKILEKKKGKIETTETPEFTVEGFWDDVMVEPVDKNSGVNDGFLISDSHKSPNDENQMKEEADGGFGFIEDEANMDEDSIEEDQLLEIKVVPPKDITPLIDQGFEKLNPERMLNKIKGIRIKDLLYAFPFFKKLFEDPDLLDHKRRFVEMRPGYTTVDNKIRCYSFFDNQRIYYIISFERKREFDKAARKIFNKREIEGGKQKDESKYRSIFVGTDWLRTSDYVEKDGNSRPCFVGHIINAHTQICAHKFYKK